MHICHTYKNKENYIENEVSWIAEEIALSARCDILSLIFFREKEEVIYANIIPRSRRTLDAQRQSDETIDMVDNDLYEVKSDATSEKAPEELESPEDVDKIIMLDNELYKLNESTC